LQDFLDLGIDSFNTPVDGKKCKKLVDEVYSITNAENLFLDESEYSGKIGLKNANPQSGFNNLAETFDLSFIEEHPEFSKTMTELLGNNYSIVLKKFIFGVPTNWMPNWVKRETNDAPVANLAAFIKPEFRNITYFHGIDFHQDVIDWKNTQPDFITLYVYLEDVDMKMSPLSVVSKSHVLGATVFPHKISMLSSDQLKYEDERGNSDILNYKFLIGKAGSINYWSALTLHGTQPTETVTDKPRISLRYLIKKDSSTNNTVLDKFLKTVKGPLILSETRKHLDEDGRAILSGNTINKSK